MIIEGENLEKFRHLVAWQGLCMETRHRLSSYGGANCYAWVKQATGLTGNRKTLLPKYAAWLIEQGVIEPNDRDFIELTNNSQPKKGN